MNKNINKKVMLIIIILLIILSLQFTYYKSLKKSKIIKTRFFDLAKITGHYDDATDPKKYIIPKGASMADNPTQQGITETTFKRLWKTDKIGALTHLYGKLGSSTGGIMRLFYNPSDPTWADENDGMMATFLGGKNRWISKICLDKAKDIGSGANEASLVIGKRGSSFAHVEGEKTKIETNNGTQYLYSVSWGANSFECDMTFTVYLGDFNVSRRIVLQAPDFSEFADPTEEEKKNQTVSDFYVGYHTQDYSQACIRFENVPWCLPDFGGRDLCNDVTDNSRSDIIPDSNGPFG